MSSATRRIAIGFCLLLPAWALAASKPAIVYGLGGKYDNAVNQQVYEQGVQRFSKETGVAVTEREPAGNAERQQMVRELAKQGFNPIVLVGDSEPSSLITVADEFPKTRFTLLDAQLAKPNVRSLLFDEQEAAFLIGAMAAAESETGIIGFVGGMDLPAIRRYACGYEQGARYANPSIDIKQAYVTSTPNMAFNDPAKGTFVAKGLIDDGADILFAAARGTGKGVYQAAADASVKAIGSDYNQNSLYPGTMLTSLYKNLPLAAYLALEEGETGTWQAGARHLGLADDYVGWALDKQNQDLLSPALRAKLEELRVDILTGKIQVHDYLQDGQCALKKPQQGALCPPQEQRQPGGLCKS